MKFLVMLTMLLFSCTTDKPAPTKPVIEQEVTNVKQEIFNVVENSPGCTEYYWKNRGKAFKSYMNGMSLMYAKQVCNNGSDFIKTKTITGRNSIQEHKDALKYYGIEGSELNTYTFLIGLGMRESTGRYCAGRDRSASFTKSSSAEAGIFQMAYVARVFNEELKPLYLKFKNGELPCELETFKKNVTCKPYDSKTFGTGEGADWQKLMKKCPAASAQWAAILIRSNYRHFGPIKRKEVEFRIQCKEMLKKVEQVALKDCSQL